MTKLDEIVTMASRVANMGLQPLTAEQQAYLDKHNIELVIMQETEDVHYFIVPGQEMGNEISDENLHNYQASKGGGAAECFGSAGTGSTASTLGGTVLTCLSSLGSVGVTVGTAGTAGSGYSSDKAADILRDAVNERLDELNTGQQITKGQ